MTSAAGDGQYEERYAAILADLDPRATWELRPKVKCKLCGARWPNVEIEVSTPAAKMGA